MGTDLLFVAVVLLGTLVMFMLGKIRYDLVALVALFLIVVSGIISPEDAFYGFSHPAVITVACVLVVSRGLLNAGIVDLIASLVNRVGNKPFFQRGILSTLVALSSGFMNNVGSLSLFIPITLSVSKKHKISPSSLLMPLAFASLLGGMVTLIGTPPNIIIATFRGQQEGMEAFRMFDFSYVGGFVAIVGLLFVIFVGWRLIPQRKGQSSSGDIIEIAKYITEVRVPEKSEAVGKRLSELEYDPEEITIVGLIRGEQNYPDPYPTRTIREEDILVVKADTDELQGFLDAYGFELAESKAIGPESLGSEKVGLLEVVVMPDSFMEGRTAGRVNLRNRFGINLLAVAREGGGLRGRLSNIRIRAGDVLLLQGNREILHEIIPRLGFLPLAERSLRLGQPRRVLLAFGAFALAVALSAIGLLPIQISFLGAAIFMVLGGFLSLKDAYASIDWPVIILLGAMFPLSQALDQTGGTELIASGILQAASQADPWVALTIVFVGTMFLSDLVNNTAATVLMAPIALNIAYGLEVSPDSFLMAVAISASCAFLTPVGHQSNTLVMGPGGYRFSDYWRMGLPLEAIIVVTAIPLLLIFWPL